MSIDIALQFTTAVVQLGTAVVALFAARRALRKSERPRGGTRRRRHRAKK